jgi:hypothetical protein
MRGTRLPGTEFGGAAMTTSPTHSWLSRYPPRTAPAVPGHVHTRLRPPPAATGPPWPTDEVLARAGLVHVRGHGWPSTGSSQAGSQGVVAAELVGGRRGWRR